MSHLTLTPAYGRDYRSKSAVLTDWEAGKDFRSVGYHGTGYINRADVAKITPPVDVNIRYQKLTKVLVIPAGK